jgi:hypothetical protein
MRALQADVGLRHSLATHGLQTIEERHTCRHRVDKLLAVIAALNTDIRPALPMREEAGGRGPAQGDASGTPKTAAA